MRFLVLLMITLCISLSAQNEYDSKLVSLDPNRSVVTEYYFDGKPKLWRQTLDGKAHGLWLEWYTNGQIRYRALWKSDKGHGLWEYFFDNGQVQSVGTYENDIPVGAHYEYHSNGQLAKKTVYVEGLKNGEEIAYNTHGIQSGRSYFINGEKVIDRPQLYQSGVISTDDHDEWDICFFPDGKSAVFTRRDLRGGMQKIFEVEQEDGGIWKEPVVAPFSTDRDEGGFVSADGAAIFFASSRTVKGWKNQTFDMNIWKVEKTADGWAEPYLLPFSKARQAESAWTANYEAGPSIRGDFLYYWTQSSRTNVTNLYRINLKDKEYNTFELLPPSSDQHYDSNPILSNDGQYLIFASDDRSDGLGNSDLYISSKKDGVWSTPTNLGSLINTKFNEGHPRFSPDGKYFYFSSDRSEKSSDIYLIESQFIFK